MARFVIDAGTLLHLLDHDLHLDPEHQLVAPNAIRSEALQLLLTTSLWGYATRSQRLRCTSA
jgi:hypothetical protein